MLNAEIYITANTDCVAENCIKFLLWNNRPVLDTINASVNHATDYFPGIREAFTVSIMGCLRDATASPAAFSKFINERRKTLVRPHMRTATDYISSILDTSLTVEEIISAVRLDMGL